MKTGYTQLAGHTLVATATRNGRTLIAVVMNTWDTYGWAAQYFDQGFAMPANAKGTGERLPPVRVSPYSQRVADQTAFLALTKPAETASIVPVDVATTTSTTPAERAAVAGTTVAPSTTTAAKQSGSGGSGSAGNGTTATTAPEKHSGHSSGLFSWRTFFIIVLLLAITVVLLRRRAVKRQRARRLAQRRRVRDAMRRGSLQVVDGRYRIGTRMGPPVESHVNVQRQQRPPNGKTG
jgi:D-alanyl-D-alanine carboxypeptidase (penicillin-binding protein 5/6)